MSVFHGNDLRKPSGARKRRLRDKKLFELGRPATNTQIAKEEEERKSIRVHSGTTKVRLKNALYANVYNPETKETKKAKILTEKENKANRNYARMNVLTKGAIIETEAGFAKITSRPGQSGVVNAITTEYVEVKKTTKRRAKAAKAKAKAQKPEKIEEQPAPEAQTAEATA